MPTVAFVVKAVLNTRCTRFVHNQSLNKGIIVTLTGYVN